MPFPPPCRAVLKTTTLVWAALFAANLALVQIPKPTDAPKPALMNVLKFGIFERAFTQQRSYTNCYVGVTANATFIQPDGRQRSVPMFWDGGEKSKVRFSPDVLGAWSWSVASTDPGLNGANGSFHGVASTNRGGITAMTGYPYHFQ